MELSPEVQELVDQAKVDGYRPMAVQLGGRTYIYRGMNRPEWKDYTKSQNVLEGQEPPSKDEIEESLVARCVIWPDVTDLSLIPGGNISILAELIMVASGFEPLNSEPVEL
jgi:hypothetical protein